MTAYDMIIVGLGPAGAYLGHRAQARGLTVLGIDPAESWGATYGGWVDELADAPLYWRGFPTVRFGGLGYVLDREYGLIDAAAWRTTLLDFPTMIENAEILSANHVRVGEQDFWAQVVVDARGALAHDGPVQQAVGWFLSDGPTTWMDVRGESFCYAFPTARGHLVEETALALPRPTEWEKFEEKLRDRCPDEQPRDVERVLIPLDCPAYEGPALPYGARAGFIDPVSGYSLGTSISMAEPTLDALWNGGTLPWRTRTFRLDRAVRLWLLEVMLHLEPADVQAILRATLRSPMHAEFLRQGDLGGTVRGMAWVFAAVPWRTKAAIVKSVGARRR